MGGFSTSGLAGRPPHPMRLDIDVTVDAAFYAAMIFAAAVEQHAAARRVPMSAERRQHSAAVTIFKHASFAVVARLIAACGMRGT